MALAIRRLSSIAAIAALAVFGTYYLMTVTEPQPTIVITIAAGIAGLGGYELKKQNGGGK